MVSPRVIVSSSNSSPKTGKNRMTMLPTCERDLTNGRNAQEICARRVMVRRAYPEGRSDAHSRCGDFDDRNDFDGRAGSGPDV
jgi:hypothetical protein